MIILSASLLAANALHLEEELDSIEGLVQSIHLDVMDGHQVANMGLSLETIHALPKQWRQEAHLMVSNQEDVMQWLAHDPIALYYIHPQNWHQWYGLQKQFPHKRFGLVLNPEDPIDDHLDLLNIVEDVLVMGVMPGFSGQTMLADTITKTSILHQKFPKLQIAVDGGVNDQNAPALITAGAQKLIIGSYLFHAANRQAAINKLLKAS